MRISLAVLSAVCLLPVRLGVAEAQVVLAPTTRIRYTLSSGESTATGEVIIQRGDSVWVRSLTTGRKETVALRQLTRMEVSRGQRHYTLRGTGIGLLAGAAAGAWQGYSADLNCSGTWCPTTRRDRIRRGALGWGLLGAGIGALVGHHFSSDRWEPVALTISAHAGIGARSAP